jgi:NAD(P)-dependent dehydrogenase (short-subunit alcohol dehydrogenase family)
MPGIDYTGKRALVVGGATGMGAAAAQNIAALGAEVVVMDYAPVDYPVKESYQVDLREPAKIDEVLDQIGAPVHAVFSAAGVADGTPGIMKINFIAHRHIIERLVASDALGRGGAICLISSAAGLGWEGQMETLKDFLATPDYASANAWIQSHDGTDHYMFSKQAINCYVAMQAYPLMAKGIRINAICPGPTDTPLARANADLWLTFGQDYRDATGTKYLTPDQMADTMAFLNSDAASGISGINVLVDAGHVMSSLTGSWEPGEVIIKMLMGRP